MLVVGVHIWCRFAFQRGDTRGVTGTVRSWVRMHLRGCSVSGGMTTSMLALSLEDSAHVSLRSLRVLPLASCPR